MYIISVKKKYQLRLPKNHTKLYGIPIIIICISAKRRIFNKWFSESLYNDEISLMQLSNIFS